MLLSLSWKYFLLVFLAVVGIIQGAAAHGNRRGLQFFASRSVSYLFAALCIGFSLIIFFNWNYRYATSVIEGAEQAGLFALAAAAALICTLGISSAIRSAYARHQVTHEGQLRTLRRASVYHVTRDDSNGRH